MINCTQILHLFTMYIYYVYIKDTYSIYFENIYM